MNWTAPGSVSPRAEHDVTYLHLSRRAELLLRSVGHLPGLCSVGEDRESKARQSLKALMATDPMNVSSYYSCTEDSHF